MSEGRLHVHLGEDLKQQFKARCAFKDLSNYTRYLIRAFVEDRCMILSKEVLEIIDKGDFQEAVDLLLPGLQQLREERMQAGKKRRAAKKKAASDKGRKKGGVKTPEEIAAQEAYKKYMEGFK